jgi:hypothetical protein
MTHHKHDSHYHPHVLGKSAEFGNQPHPLAAITKEQREHMIAEAAYYIAEHRHFQGGEQICDWLQAQAEVDNKMKLRLVETKASAKRKSLTRIAMRRLRQD